MPYVTEELYQRLPHHPTQKSNSICISNFPQSSQQDFDFAQVDEHVSKLLTTVKALRSQLAALNVATNAKPTVVVQTSKADLLDMFKSEVDVVTSLVKAGETVVISDKESEPQGCVKGFVSDEICIYVKVIGLIDISLEVARINKRVKQLEDLRSKQQQKMSIPDYMTKVPEKVRNENTEKLAGYDNELAEVHKQVALMEKFL